MVEPLVMLTLLLLLTGIRDDCHVAAERDEARGSSRTADGEFRPRSQTRLHFRITRGASYVSL